MSFAPNATKMAEWAALGAKLGFTDFDPTSVDWDKPVPWGNDPANCNMQNDKGCLMPLYAGL